MVDFFNRIFPKSKIYAFEPSIKDFECLKLNVENKNLFQKALWINQSIKTFYIKSNSADSSIFEINDYESKIDIETINLDSLKSDSNSAKYNPEFILDASHKISLNSF